MILHITTADAWDAARAQGVYRAPSLDTEGFINFSTSEQLPGTADRFYAGVPGLVVLRVDEAALGSRLPMEATDPPTGEVFPHLYGPLAVDEVIDVLPLERLRAGG